MNACVQIDMLSAYHTTACNYDKCKILSLTKIIFMKNKAAYKIIPNRDVHT